MDRSCSWPGTGTWNEGSRDGVGVETLVSDREEMKKPTREKTHEKQQQQQQQEQQQQQGNQVHQHLEVVTFWDLKGGGRSTLSNSQLNILLLQ